MNCRDGCAGGRHEDTCGGLGADAAALGAEELALLREVANGNVSWHERSIRLWTSEREYTLATRAGQRLVRLGLVSKEPAGGTTFATRGPIELTDAGKLALAGRGRPAEGSCAGVAERDHPDGRGDGDPMLFA